MSRHRAPRDDAGFTLVEMIVSMSVFMVFLAIVMSAIAMLHGSLTTTTNRADATTRARAAIALLDRQLRYATAVNTPVTSSNDVYLEFQGLTTAGAARCYQWRVQTSTKRLQERDWTPGSPSSAVWRSVSTGIANTTAQAPFTFSAATATAQYQSVLVDLYVTVGTVRAQTVRVVSTLQARNTSTTTATNAADGTAVCTEAGRS